MSERIREFHDMPEKDGDRVSILKAVHVEKVYRNGPEELRILNDVTLEIDPGRIVVITGESGSGKSTFLNLVGGLDLPTGGEIYAAGYKVSHLPESELTVYRSNVTGFIFQFHYLLKDFTALENVMLPAYMNGVSKKDALKRAASLLDEVRLSDRMHHYPSELSGGERQRVAVARALVNNPELVLADEPTGNLDEKNARIVSEILFSLVRTLRKTLILVTHDRQLARSGDLQYHLEHGELANL